jgi:hypothetical protein
VRRDVPAVGSRRTVLLTLVVFAPIWVRGQEDPCRQRTISVSVANADNSPIRSFNAADFIGRYKGKPVQVNSVTRGQPNRILLLLDASSSVLGNDRPDGQLAMDIVRDVALHIPPDVQVGFASFSTEIELRVPPTIDRRKVTDEIGVLEATRSHLERYEGSRKTSLWDAIESSISLLGPDAGGDVLFVITDAEDNHSKTKRDKVLQEMLSAGIRLFTVAIVDRTALKSRLEVENPDQLFDLVTATGGMEVIPPLSSSSAPEARDLAPRDKSGKPSTLRAALDLEYRQIMSIYYLEMTFPEPTDRSTRWDLGLASPDRSSRSKTLLLYPRRLVSCK